ncbi:hypothetical protein [Syntrophus aciditrophicus]|nr:hypothetical protein [Syntrophus aciditrophicus]
MKTPSCSRYDGRTDDRWAASDTTPFMPGRGSGSTVKERQG